MALRKPTTRFLNLIDDAKLRIQEIPVEDVLYRFQKRALLNLVDVREYREFLGSHIENCRHISRGVLERQIEVYFKELDTEIILYSQDGYRSALAADALQKMGYSNVYSMAGGYRAWKNLGGPICLA